jgi:predicted amidophosphoribosyltransferase
MPANPILTLQNIPVPPTQGRLCSGCQQPWDVAETGFLTCARCRARQAVPARDVSPARAPRDSPPLQHPDVRQLGHHIPPPPIARPVIIFLLITSLVVTC